VSARFSVWVGAAQHAREVRFARLERLDPAGIVRGERVHTAHEVQRRAPLRAGLGERERAGAPVECDERLATARLNAPVGPVQTPGDHQVNDDEELPSSAITMRLPRRRSPVTV